MIKHQIIHHLDNYIYFKKIIIISQNFKTYFYNNKVF